MLGLPLAMGAAAVVVPGRHLPGMLQVWCTQRAVKHNQENRFKSFTLLFFSGDAFLLQTLSPADSLRGTN